jgi:hypothetical protein
MARRELADAEFFALVHQVLDAQHHRPGIERREKRRQRYPRWQFIAPLLNDELPAADDFEQFLCYDLSESGFSYLALEPPPSQRLVVALGDASYIYLSAAVVHHRPFDSPAGPRLLVGCRFLSRLVASGRGPLATATAGHA